jgi:hypothetical protein
MQMNLFPNDLFTIEKSQEICEATHAYITRACIADQIRHLASGYSLTHRALPETTDEILSGHHFPWFESQTDMQISFNLTTFGYYKAAHGALRSALDLGLLLVYWSINEDGHSHSALKRWLRSRDSTPFASQVWKRVASHPNFKAFQASFDIAGQFKDISGLGDFVHTKGAKFSNVLPFPGTSVRIPGQQFSEEAVDSWLRRFAATVRFLVTCYLVRYPIGTVRYNWHRKFAVEIPAFGGLPGNWIDILEDLVTPEVFRKITALAKTDLHVEKVMEWVEGLPDLSEQDINDQIFEHEKTSVRDMGLTRWLEIIDSWQDASDDKTTWDNLRSRVLNWAREESIDGTFAGSPPKAYPGETRR